MRIAALVLVPLACGNDGADGANDADEVAPASTAVAALDVPAGLSVFVEFPRYLHAARRLEVGFDNAGDTALTVTRLALRSPLFEPAEPESPETLVAPGRRRDLQIGLGRAVCPAPPGPSLVEVTAIVDGAEQHGVVEVDPAPLERISTQECGAELALERIAVGFGPTFSVADGAVAASIEIERRRGDEPVAVVAMRGSVIIELRPAADATPIAALAASDTAVSVPVQLRVIRCDPHAVTESKKTFVLAIWVAIGDRDPQRLAVEPEGDLRAALQGLIDDCLRAEAAG